MGFCKCVRNLDGVSESFIHGQPLAPHELVQGPAGNELHSDKRAAALIGDVVHVDDIGMIQRGGCLGLLHEASLPLWFSYCLGAEYLDGDGSVQVGIERLLDHAHATLAELRFDPVVAQGLADHDLVSSLGDLPAELGMARSVNLAHAAGPNRSRDSPQGPSWIQSMITTCRIIERPLKTRAE